jgi:hypothetical protein
MLRLIASTLGVLMTVFFVVIVIMFIYPYTVAKIMCPAEVMNNNREVKVGDVLHYKLPYNTSFEMPEMVSQQLIIGNHTIASADVPNLKIEPDKDYIDMQLLIPKTADIGKARVKLMLRYKTFYGLQIVDRQRETESFTITTE